MGTLYYPNKQKCYEGEWKRNLFCGYGHLYNSLPTESKGVNFVDFSKNMGKCWREYKGYLMDDKKNGKGVLSFGSGEKFEGDFRDDRIEGEGEFFRKDGKVVKGVWRNNKLL